MLNDDMPAERSQGQEAEQLSPKYLPVLSEAMAIKARNEPTVPLAELKRLIAEKRTAMLSARD
jgi:hypothetical protein